VEGSNRDVLRAFGAANVAKAHADLERMLGSNHWLVGDQRTLADAYFIGIARWTKYHDVVDRRDYPGLQRLFEKLEADPAVRFAHAVGRGGTAVSGGGFLGEVTLDDVLPQQTLAA
jgi:glutathione S-transferase